MSSFKINIKRGRCGGCDCTGCRRGESRSFIAELCSEVLREALFQTARLRSWRAEISRLELRPDADIAKLMNLVREEFGCRSHFTMLCVMLCGYRGEQGHATSKVDAAKMSPASCAKYRNHASRLHCRNGVLEPHTCQGRSHSRIKRLRILRTVADRISGVESWLRAHTVSCKNGWNPC